MLFQKPLGIFVVGMVNLLRTVHGQRLNSLLPSCTYIGPIDYQSRVPLFTLLLISVAHGFGNNTPPPAAL